MSRHCLSVAGLWVFPKSVFFALSTYDATVTAKVPEQPFALHPTITGSCLASGGRARKDSSRLCSRINAMASRKFARHSSSVLPCPLAPGTSAQYATNQGPSRSMIAVNSLCMDIFYALPKVVMAEVLCCSSLDADGGKSMLAQEALCLLRFQRTVRP